MNTFDYSSIATATSETLLDICKDAFRDMGCAIPEAGDDSCADAMPTSEYIAKRAELYNLLATAKALATELADAEDERRCTLSGWYDRELSKDCSDTFRVIVSNVDDHISAIEEMWR